MKVKTNVRAGRQNRRSDDSSSETPVVPVSRCVGI